MWPPGKLIPDLHSLNFTKEKMNWLSFDQTMKILLQSDQIVSGNHSLSQPQFLSSLFVFENKEIHSPYLIFTSCILSFLPRMHGLANLPLTPLLKIFSAKPQDYDDCPNHLAH